MSEGKYLYFKDQFEILETELKKTLDGTYDFFKKYDEINPADSTIKIKNIMDKISELKKKEYELRLENEIEMIIKMGFAGYFLIVSDFIGYAKKQNIPVEGENDESI